MCEISIITPVYNKEKYLKDTVRSVSEQTFGDFELLLIDDGSTDASGIICDELAASDPRIKVFHTENRGVSAARNHGIRNAAGKYICFIDADDLIEKSFLEKLYGSMKTNDSELAVCGYYEVKYGKRIDRELKRISDQGDEVFEVLVNNILCVLWNKMFIKEKIRHLFEEGLATCEDSLFCAQYYYDNLPKTSYVNECLYGYLRHRNGLTSSFQERALCGIERNFRCCMKIKDRIRDEQHKRLAVHYLCRVYFYGICLFVFETLCRGPVNKETLSQIDTMIRHTRYRKNIKYFWIYPFYDRRALRTTLKEFLYILFSLLYMKRAIYFLTKVKLKLEPYKLPG